MHDHDSTPTIPVALASLRRRLKAVDASGWSKEARVHICEKALDLIADLELAGKKTEQSNPFGMSEVLEARQTEAKAIAQHGRERHAHWGGGAGEWR